MVVGPACFNLLNRLMPAVRAETARRLVEKGLAQERVAEHLGVSQAMVSKYLRRSPRPEASPNPALIGQLAESSVAVALKEEGRGRIAEWCPVCVVFSDRGLVRTAAALDDSGECLRHERSHGRGERESILKELAEAEQQIRKLRFGRLLPQVRSNLARALPNAKDSRDVAAFPGRLVELKEGVRAAAPPEFGSSSHLAQLLLRLRRNRPELASILNLRADEPVRRATRAAGLRLRALKRTGKELAVSSAPRDGADVLLDPGAFGIEPALYVVGTTAHDVVDKVERILQELPKGAHE